jgi:hypothetical protein
MPFNIAFMLMSVGHTLRWLSTVLRCLNRSKIFQGCEASEKWIFFLDSEELLDG